MRAQAEVAAGTSVEAPLTELQDSASSARWLEWPLARVYLPPAWARMARPMPFTITFSRGGGMLFIPRIWPWQSGLERGIRNPRLASRPNPVDKVRSKASTIRTCQFGGAVHKDASAGSLLLRRKVRKRSGLAYVNSQCAAHADVGERDLKRIRGLFHLGSFHL